MQVILQRIAWLFALILVAIIGMGLRAQPDPTVQAIGTVIVYTIVLLTASAAIVVVVSEISRNILEQRERFEAFKTALRKHNERNKE